MFLLLCRNLFSFAGAIEIDQTLLLVYALNSSLYIYIYQFHILYACSTVFELLMHHLVYISSGKCFAFLSWTVGKQC